MLAMDKAPNPSPPRRDQTGRGAHEPAHLGATRPSSLLLGMLVVALIGLAFAMALTLVSAAD